MLKKHMFGDDHEIAYDSIINHDTYRFLRVSLEVPREQDTEAIVLLNGKEVGKVVVTRNGKKTLHYTAYRKGRLTGRYHRLTPHAEFREMGRAIASIISDLIDA